jgi:hypothetical protein
MVEQWTNNSSFVSTAWQITGVTVLNINVIFANVIEVLTRNNFDLRSGFAFGIFYKNRMIWHSNIPDDNNFL